MLLNFSPINLSYVNFIIIPAEEPRRVEGISFPPQHEAIHIPKATKNI